MLFSSFDPNIKKSHVFGLNEINSPIDLRLIDFPCSKASMISGDVNLAICLTFVVTARIERAT